MEDMSSQVYEKSCNGILFPLDVEIFLFCRKGRPHGHGAGGTHDACATSLLLERHT